MPSNKAYVIMIFCFSFVLSFWLLFDDKIKSNVQISSGNLEAVKAIDIKAGSNNDWKKMLASVEQGTSTFSDLTNKTSDFENTTMTSNLAIDIFSKYLINAKEDQTISEAEAEKIISEILNSSSYNLSNSDSIYIKENLKIIKFSDKATMEKYKSDINSILTKHIQILGNSRNIGDIIYDSYIKEEPVKSPELEKFLIASRLVKNDLLGMNVPEPLSDLHLNLLNSANNIQNALESTFYYPEDPVRGFLGINKYQTEYDSFRFHLQNINNYFVYNQ